MGLSISRFINNFNFLMFLFFTLMYSYQLIYIFIAFKAKREKKREEKEVTFRRYAVIISARNEGMVIGELIKSIKNQKYPQDLVDIFVVADNCTDNTASASSNAGAIVRERFNADQVGKGYALDFMMKIIEKEYSYKKYAGYFVIDADNLLDENYIAEMNKSFGRGYRILTSYRNSKNYDQNWISAGYSLWFLHEAEYLNLPRMTINASCAISGTGFLLDAELIRSNGGWVHHLLTEDIEFSACQIIKGEKIGYCRNAIIYDEQPVTFTQSWNQRLRWAKGFYQVFAKYGRDLVRGIFKGKRNGFSCFDMTMTIMPGMLISSISIMAYAGVCLAGIFDMYSVNEIIHTTTKALLGSSVWYYCMIFMLGFITTLTEWKKIHCSGWKKVAYMFTFPLFMFTYVPISVVALVKDVKWKPITHTVVKTVDEITRVRRISMK